MAQQLKILSARQIDALPVGFHKDGGNLYLRVRDNESRAWVFRYKVGGKAIEIGLGATKSRSLADAREKAEAMRKKIANGENPATVLNKLATVKKMTFTDCAEELIQSKRAGWRNEKHEAQWHSTLQQYAYPVIGSKKPADITLADVKSILSPLWATKTETATRLRGRIEAVIDYDAVHQGNHGRYNPARWKANLDMVLPPARKVMQRTHFKAAPYADVPQIMSALRSMDFLSAYCLRFGILTAGRSGEVRGALWSEIDFANKTWTIQPSRMKANKLHRVPLNVEAMAILTKMKEWRLDDNERVFTGARGGLLSDVAVNKTLHLVAADATVHGFRSSFRDWGAEQTSFPSAVLELALAHVNQNQVEAAYQRSDLFDRRVELMTAWGNYCSSKCNVISMVA